MRDIAIEVGKASPPAGVSVLAIIQGWDWGILVAMATVLYIGLQAAYLIWKWQRDWRLDWRRKRR